MKKRILSILLCCVMLVGLLPTAAFAEGSAEEPPVCSCETACTAEAMNADCPICGVEGALPENCAKCAQPADDAAVQPEGEVSDPQPKTALTALIGGNETVTEVSTADELTAAIAGVKFDTVKLAANISISSTLTVNRPDVTLDLNGYTLTCGDAECDDIFSVNEHGNLTVKDSGTGGKIDGQNNNCGFSINGGILTLKSGTIINCTTNGDGGAVDISDGGKFEMSGGAITNCKTNDDSGAVDIGDGCTFIMNSGTISGCSVDDDAGAIFIKGNASFVMNGGTIENCSAGNNGGAVKMRSTSRFTMNGGTISSCTAQQGGGVYVDGSSTFTMNDGSIENCTAVNGGDSVFVFQGGGGKFIMTNGTVDGSITMPYTVGNNTVYMDGLGTAAYPYQISTADQLKLFRDIVNGTGGQALNRGAYAVLTAAIDLNNEPWTPIGNYTEGNQIYYEGTFDGGGHTISGLNVTGNFRYASLFGAVKGGTIKNLTVAGNVSHNYYYYSTGLDCHVGGIVGGALDAATIENCSNNCSVTGSSRNYIGGIAGSNIDNARIIDCYNVGTITGTIYETGGVTGLNMGTISNCYNVGTVKGNYAVGEIVGRNNGTVENCYYLAGTNLNAVGQNNSNGNITKTESKTAANFANDTVLALLKAGERDNNADPWADECKYLAAADKTLPVFNGQGDAHDHQSNDWKSNETEHWQVCTCGVVFHKAEHSGGKATCIAKAVCEFCKAEYGEKLPHDFTAETVDAKYLKSAATCTEKAVYYKSCAVCGLSSEGTADEATFFSGNVLDHDWGTWTSNGDGTHTRTCTVDGCSAGTQTENCIDANKDHKCDICDYIISECADDNKDHKCDYCGKKLTEHTGGKATCTEKAVCEVCGKAYGEFDANNHSDLKHIDAKAATKDAEGNIEYWYCEGCGKYFSDKDGTKEIKKADTVTAKLKDDSKLPQTGDISNLALWIALLFISGGAAIGTTVVSRKKKYNR